MILFTIITLIFFMGNTIAEPTPGKDCASVTRPSDCGDLDKSTCKSGIYKIFPDKTSGFKVFCEMKKHGGGWTVFQRRMDGKTNFYRDWDSYKEGFGNQNGEIWLGNDHLHQLTSQGNESSGYILDVSGYSGDAGDSLTYHNGQKFSTKDKGNGKGGKGCAVKYTGAWWYNGCHKSNLNGLYLKGKHKSFADGIDWKTWKGYHYSLKETVMMIRKA
ncbi:Ficolin-1-A,Ryncolin-1,Fibrinogen C domain-containing protein 1,Angiopoietin-related protein 7,Fibrinogen C domain-containing protein 1-B,Fibrinogen-like protein 1,Ficolin-1,Ficolin-1-B,Angiopoietin-4,Tenascin-R,Ryncolin-2,Techylectin-5B,Fibrinogen C domain-containing protein 1-A,Microfibril-associated glycoprotein 4,Fibrinogen-like protein A,Ryncolin-3,Angiopoietin-2,Tenascin-X,Ficolin-2,Tenascin,Techylectin-5A,Ryncolin-4,Techylectin-like protein [Mytilus edulis]|uniref:Fibrinogen C-terminal domain-containing protein n=1 Tax=Mytilus edulis TaxID=6550 RepID=A0A8S3R745_MYTED|nr:Ficolin-1-A,Ryncolin-1,Fibrinogen C domain-containing protein 1,Angiopoietin-related protein 7,Fibrinogen C domain-containing protein 1-B,Fibrinogen-like protein 1,Ficolin-1,Ficolin-1-B,Angiopoietin-4,Tenascin-R,Ryncolin-2,Techylectin-5B,Fibrinogen C domain-containing protein 1-A,Microfibril-associated glycoprotein 4,Fibrinogen-like protein A,Ryncolin-3,Angiopoietin-2,Tenascin-X,Ficolin-2,Tenascin,Techylectin-5A,Ryncolin-4,Techylectin-like protein [Mytilus edulis]